MSDERIERILGKIKQYWIRNPKLTFCQVLTTLDVIPEGQTWNVKDEVIQALLDTNKELLEIKNEENTNYI